jgi:hypothetical protein
MIGPIGNILGAFFDYVHVPYDPDDITTIMGYLRTGYFHVHGASFIYPDKAAPVELTSAAGAWAITGNKIEVIPANAITKNFDLHWASISTISAELDGVIDIFAGPAPSEVQIGAVDVSRTTNFSREGAMPVQIPQQPANTRISCRFSDSTAQARTVRVKFYGHVYDTSLV